MPRSNGAVMLLRLLFMGAIACFLAGTRARADVTLVQDGEARATIHAPAEVLELQDRHLAALKNPERDAEAQRVGQQAPLRDLARYLEKMSGATIAVAAGGKGGDKGAKVDWFSVG